MKVQSGFFCLLGKGTTVLIYSSLPDAEGEQKRLDSNLRNELYIPSV
jgi:hypothetical protein